MIAAKRSPLSPQRNCGNNERGGEGEAIVVVTEGKWAVVIC
jgi:hypothetical protein